MQAMQKGKAAVWRARAAFKPLLVAAGLAVGAAAGGCSSAIETPLPDVHAVGPTALTQAERAKAIADLNRARATHEQDAEQQIEQSR